MSVAAGEIPTATYVGGGAGWCPGPGFPSCSSGFDSRRLHHHATSRHLNSMLLAGQRRSQDFRAFSAATVGQSGGMSARTIISIDDVLGSLIAREGGFVDHPADRGGPTKYGITLATLSHWRDQPVGRDDVAALTEAEARAIYRERYWRGPGLDRLPTIIQPAMLDAAVHMGPAAAVRLLQRVLAAGGWEPGPVDGIIGPRTIAAAEAAVDAIGERLVVLLLVARANDLRRLIARDPSQRVFARGWQARLEGLMPPGFEEERDACRLA